MVILYIYGSGKMKQKYSIKLLITLPDVKEMSFVGGQLFQLKQQSQLMVFYSLQIHASLAEYLLEKRMLAYKSISWRTKIFILISNSPRPINCKKYNLNLLPNCIKVRVIE